jgi:DNA-directed RNA polymerase specialized sigma subunit
MKTERLTEETQIKIMTDGMTQHEVASVLGITRYQVDKLEKKALRKLKYLLNLKYEKKDWL